MLQDRKLLRPPYSKIPLGRTYAGFTLVEMLVSLALVMLMMVLFAQVFQQAGGSISKMKGLVENDQRARSLQSIIKADLDKRTTRWVYPFAANENTSAPSSNISQRQGYIYISENNPVNELDDVLQFTVMSTITIRNSDTTPYYGQASNLPQPPSPPSTPPYLPPPYLTSNFGYANQPDADDAVLNPNNTGLSTVSEVAYFVRNGNLYRRQLLLRDPLNISGTNSQPADNNGRNIFDPTIAPTADVLYPNSFAALNTTTFWADFDYSAVLTVNGSLASTGAQFNSADYLDNSSSFSTAMAFPPNRFGFSPNLGAPFIAGRSKEFISNVNTDDLNNFLGRFTLEECSNPSFRYPQDFISTGANYASTLVTSTTPTTTANVPTDPNLILTLDPNTKVVNSPQDFSNGFRRGEDLVLTNVHAFDIQVWDQGISQFVNVGDPSLVAAADYASSNRLNTVYGPRVFGTGNPETATALNAVYDTWHPQTNINLANDPSPSPNPSTGQTTFDDPPFQPVYHTTAALPAWQTNTPYTAGTSLVFPAGPAGTYYAAPYTTTIKKLPYGAPFYYRCVQSGTSAASSPPVTSDFILEPTWPLVDGMTVTDGTVIWQAVDNRKPLKAIRLRVRFVDQTTKQMRQLTIVQSLVD